MDKFIKLETETEDEYIARLVADCNEDDNAAPEAWFNANH